MSEKKVPIITDRKEIYKKCENMEQLFDKYYLPLLIKHFEKIYELQQENQQLKERQERFIKYLTEKSEEIIRDAGYHQRICVEILEKFKDIIGSDK